MTLDVKKIRKTRKIRDVIHNYIEITSIEETLINSKEFQRLRFISQNSLAYYTYPSNTTNRFSHSLGVMHIGGQILCKALENTDKDTLVSFLGECQKIIERTCRKYDFPKEDLEENWINYFGNISGFNSHPIDLSEPQWLTPEQITYLNVMWQAVRIACMIHDIGHFPFSHLFEHALNNFIKDSNFETNKSIKTNIKNWEDEYLDYLTEIRDILNSQKIGHEDVKPVLPHLHEIQGVLILRSFIPNNESGAHDAKFGTISKICLTLGKAIFIHNRTSYNIGTDNKAYGILDSLHTIVSSEIDADRLDYCIRDPFASGIELGAFDLNRILRSAILRKREESRENFHIVFGINGISAVESFFHQRFLMYEHLIYHHNVARLDGTLEHTLGLIFKLYDKDTTVKNIIEDFGLLSVNETTGAIELFKKYEFYSYDDYWLKTLLVRVYSELTKIFTKKKSENPAFKSAKLLKELYICLKIVLFRNNNHITSLWKKIDDIDHEISLIEKQLPKDLVLSYSKDNESNQDRVKDFIIKKFNTLFENDDYLEDTTRKNIIEELSKQDLYLIIKRVSKKIFDTDIENNAIVESRSGNKPAYMVSSYLNSLKYCTEKNVHYNIFIIGENIREDSLLGNTAKEILIKNITNYIISDSQNINK